MGATSSTFAPHGVRPSLGPVAVLLLGALLATCRVDQLIAPSTATIRLIVAADTVGIADTTRLVARVTVDGKQNPALRVKWSTDLDTVATVDTTGLVRGIRRGTATITARVENELFLPAPLSASAVVQVVVPRLLLAPSDTSFPSVGDTICLRATALDAIGDTLPGLTPSYSVTIDPDSTVVPDGPAGCFRARRSGATASVRAVLDTLQRTATLPVRQVAASITVTPDSVHFHSLTQQQALTAAAADKRGNPIALPTLVWTSLDTTVTVTSTGVVTAHLNGATWVRAADTAGTGRDSARVIVQQVAAGIGVSPATDTLRTVRGRATLIATVRDSLNQQIGAASPVWTSLAPDSVRIVTYGGNSAVAEAVAEGSATIVAQDTVAGQVLTGTARITTRYRLASLSVSPPTATLSAIGDTVRFTATARDANDSVVPQPRPVWRVVDSTRVRIDPVTGLATARNPGATSVIAGRDSVADTAAASVTPPVLDVGTAAFVDSMLRSSPDSVSAIRTVGNVGTGTLGARLTIVHGATWLAVAPDTVTIPASSSTSVRLTARAGALTEGNYADTVRVQALGAAGSPKDIPVQFRVYCPLTTIAPDTAHAASLTATDCRARHQAGSFADYYRFASAAGDTIHVAMTTNPTSLDTYLYLLDSTGAVVASNDNCPGVGLNSCLQFVVPAAGPYTIEATSFTAGATFAYTLGLTRPLRPAAATALAQLANGTPIPVGDSANTSTIEFRATGQDPNPRDTLRLQVEVRPLAQTFGNAPTVTGAPIPNAGAGVTLSATVTGLTNFTDYHWQARVMDQTGRAGPWTAFDPAAGADFGVKITTPVLAVSPQTVLDSTVVGSSTPRHIGALIANNGTGTFTWSAVSDTAWLTLTPSGGAPGATPDLALDPTGLALGSHRGTVTITAPGAVGSPATITVTLKIQQSVLVVTPMAVADSTNAGSGQSFLRTLRIANGGNGSLSWTASHNPAKTWLSFTRTAGGAPDSIPLTVNSAGLSANTYRDTVVVTAPGATGSPASIPVTLTVRQPLLAVSPAMVQDSANAGSNTARSHTLGVTNGGDGGTLTWTVVNSAPWVTLSKSSGGGASDSVIVTLHPDTLSGGLHRDSVVFMSPEANNDPVKIPVTFDILQPVLSVTPGTIADSAIQGETAPRVRTLTVANTGRGKLVWSAVDSATWISVNPPGDTVPGSLTVTLNPSSLAVGTYTSSVVVMAPNATGSPKTIPVTFKIKPPPILSVSPTSYADSAFQGSALAKRFALHIANTGPGTLAWSAVLSSPWLTLSKAGGGAPPTDSTVVTLTPGSLAAATYNGTVTVTAPGAAGSPATVPVTFKIKPCLEPTVLPDTVIAAVVTRSDCAAPRRANSLARLYSVQAAVGDTLSLRLTAAFDAYLVLTDSFGTSLVQNDNCPAQSGPACITNFAVPGTGRYVIEATTFAAGDTGTFTLSVVRERRAGLPQSIGQFRGDSTTAIGIGLTTPQNVAVFKGTLSDPNPRDSVRLEIEMIGASSPFSGTSTHQSGYVAVGQTAWIRVPALTENAGYHWQARTCDKTLRCSVWLDFGGNPMTAGDFFVNAIPETPAVPTSIGQFQADGNTPIAGGGGSGGSSVVLKGTVIDPDPGDQVQLEVEAITVPLLGNNFTDQPTASSALGASGRVASASGPATVLLSYHWQARTCDQTGRCSAWVSFPQPTPNAETSADYVGTL